LQTFNNPIEIVDVDGLKRTVQLIGVVGNSGEIATVTNGGLDVNIQNHFTPTVIVKFNKINVKAVLSSAAIVGAYTLIVNSSIGMSIGNYLIVYNALSNRYTTFIVLNIVSNTITLDSSIDYAYPIGSNVDVGITNMNVNGSVTPQTFGIRGTEIGNEVPTTIDITRIIFKCLTSGAVDLNKFGNITTLTRGLLFRLRNGVTRNIFNVKNNGEIAGIMLDWIPYSASNPAQGVNGFTARLTFSGMEKLGVTIRLSPGEDLECLIQDDLTGITSLEITAEGSEVE